MGIADAYVAIWNAKRFYDRWRPYTATRVGDTDGNDATDPDRSWEPFCVTPPVWEYPSAHAIQSAAAAEMLVSALGNDSVSFTTTSTTAPPERRERSFTSLARRGRGSRGFSRHVRNPLPFRDRCRAGAGRALAASVLDRHLRPSNHPK